MKKISIYLAIFCFLTTSAYAYRAKGSNCMQAYSDAGSKRAFTPSIIGAALVLPIAITIAPVIHTAAATVATGLVLGGTIGCIEPIYTNYPKFQNGFNLIADSLFYLKYKDSKTPPDIYYYYYKKPSKRFFKALKRTEKSFERLAKKVKRKLNRCNYNIDNTQLKKGVAEILSPANENEYLCPINPKKPDSRIVYLPNQVVNYIVYKISGETCKKEKKYIKSLDQQYEEYLNNSKE